jgi:RimJ/RimL family protein N-acetyltransferase
MIAPFSLKGFSIRLTPLGYEHLDALCAVGLEPRLWQATTIQVRTRADMEDYIRVVLAAKGGGTALPFVIVDRATDQVIGTTRFHSIVPEHRHLEIGFTWIGIPWQRTSANTEAKYLMLRHAFESMGCIRVEFRADAENAQSRQALCRIGAHEEGVLRHCRISAHRGIRDLAVYSIIAEEWPAVRLNLEAKLAKTRSEFQP